MPLITESKRFQIVIADYNESLDWVSDCAQDAIVYVKGEMPAGEFAHVHTLPNIGRESHTYLSHIVRNYGNLADVTLFLQGNIHDTNEGTPAHTDLPLVELKKAALKLNPDERISFGPIKEFSNWDGIPWLTDGTGYFQRRGKGMRMSELTPGQFWKFVFDTEHPTKVKFGQGALFAVGKELINRRPLSFWTQLLKYFEDLNDKNPEEGHYMERFWLEIFSAGTP